MIIVINKPEPKLTKNRRSSVDNSSYEIPKLDDSKPYNQAVQFSTLKRTNKRSPSPNKVLSLEEVNSLSYSNINVPAQANSKFNKENRIFSELIGRLLMCFVNLKSVLAQFVEPNTITNKNFEISIYDIVSLLKWKFKDQLHIQLSVRGFKTVVDSVKESLLNFSNEKSGNKDLMEFINILLPSLPHEVQYDIIK